MLLGFFCVFYFLLNSPDSFAVFLGPLTKCRSHGLAQMEQIRAVVKTL